MDTPVNLKDLTPDATIDQIISADRKAGELLASIGLTPSDHKEQTLRSACQQRQWSEVELLQWVKKNRTEGCEPLTERILSKKKDFGENVPRWCEYLETDFHSKILELLQEVGRNFPRIDKVHGNQYSQLKNMQPPLDTFIEKLRFYLQFESRKFFPLTANLSDSKQTLLDGTIQKLKKGIKIIGEDQHKIMDLMNTLENRGNQFDHPDGACVSLRILNSNLKTLCAVVEQQIHIEQQIVIPLIRQKLGSE